MAQTTDPQTIADVYFYHLDNLSNNDISQMTGMNANTISPTVCKVKKYLALIKQNKEVPASVQYQQALAIIQKETELREKANKISQAKNSFFTELNQIIDDVVDGAVQEKYQEMIERNKELEELVDYLNTQLINQKIIATQYQKNFVKGKENHSCLK